ncbi:MAG: hypothetical protein H0U95_08100 [Bacteroidetes bacterium]|nr:hypothetical protein [Bacteroidota bacterium]
MQRILYKEQITILSNKPWFHILEEKTDTDKLFYEIVYNLTDKQKVVKADLSGEGATKIILIDFDLIEGVKSGFFISNKTFANIFFKVESIKLFCNADITFKLSLFH